MEIKKTDITPQQVELKDIDTSPGPYCMTFGFDLNPLILSIESVGLINSPLLIEERNGILTIVAGYRRINALKSMGCHKIPCRVLPESGLSPLESLLTNLHDNLVTRKLNEVEKGMVLNRLDKMVSRPEIIEHYMPLLDLPSHEPTLLMYVNIEARLEKEIKEYLVQGPLSLQSVDLLLKMEHDARTSVAKVILFLKFNINQQRQFIDYIIDITNANKISIQELLHSNSIQNIISDTQMNNPQKGRAVLQVLKSRRYPLLVQSEMVFKKMVSGLDLPKGVNISAPPYFESPQYRLEVLFKDGKQLAENIKRLSCTRGLEGLRNPWEEGV